MQLSLHYTDRPDAAASYAVAHLLLFYKDIHNKRLERIAVVNVWFSLVVFFFLLILFY